MKMKKMLATVMATALAVTMIPAAAFASSTEPIEWNKNNGTDQREGAGTVRQPIVEVTLPGDLAFEVDQYKLNSKAQIVGGDYAIVNRSEVPIEVQVTPFIVEADGTEIAEGAALQNSNFVSGNAIYGYKPLTVVDKKKAVSLYTIVADTTTGSIPYTNETFRFTYKGDTDIIGRGAVLEYNDDGSIKYSSVSANTAGANNGIQKLKLHKIDAAANTFQPTETFSFVLGRDEYDENGESKALDSDGSIKAAYNNIASAFTIVGAVDPTATFDDGEISVAANFKMVVLTDDKIDPNDQYGFYGHDVTTASGVTKTGDTSVARQQLKK